MQPSQVAALRRELIEWLASPDAEAYYELMKDDAGTWKQSEQREALLDAEMFFVSEEMSAVAVHASASMPDQVPRRDEFPAENGFVVWSGPLVEAEVTGELAADHENAQLLATCRVLSWKLVGVHNEDGEHVDAAFLTFWVEYPGRSYPPLIPYHSAILDLTLPIRGSAREDNRGGHEAAGEWIASFDMAVYTTMVLMGQTVSVVRTEQPDRAERRRTARADLEVRPVTVVRLRRAEAEQGADAAGDADGEAEADHVDDAQGAPAWTHRWVVRGHWRRQWYPSISDHREVWIHSYVKGPEEKPLVTSEIVNALTR